MVECGAIDEEELARVAESGLAPLYMAPLTPLTLEIIQTFFLQIVLQTLNIF